MVGLDSGVPVNGPAVTVQLTFPLSSTARDRVAISDARVLQAQAKALDTERKIELEASAGARMLGASERAANATARAREASQEELHAVELGYSNGASSSLEVSTARAAYVQALVDELASIYALLEARATLDIEVGRS
jgi:outer membrane protein TolC